MALAQEKRRKKHRIPWRDGNIFPLIILDILHLALEVDLVRLLPLRFLDDFPSDEQDGKQADHEVGEQKGRHIPIGRQKHGVAIDERHDEAAGETVPGEVGLAPALVGQSVAVKALGLAGAIPEDEGHAHARVIDQLGRGDEIDEPFKDDRGAVADLEKG